MERHTVVVVGAGPAGLAAAATLKTQGFAPLVLERGEAVGAAWRDRRYDRLHLHTVRWLSHLPGYRIPRSFGKWVHRDRLVEYLERYARRYGVEPRFGVAVERIDRVDGVWRLATSAGPVDAERVVVATGYSNEPVLPDWPGRDSFPGALVHSADYRNADPYRGRDVLVVGSGNSGAEIAVDLAEGGAAKVRIAVRTPPNIVRRDRFGIPSQLIGIAIKPLPLALKNPIGRVLRKLTIPDLEAYGLPAAKRPFDAFLRTSTVPILDVGFIEAVQAGRVEVVPALERLEGSEVVLAGGRSLSPDAIVAATGFRPGLEPVVGHLGVLDERGVPVVHGSGTHPAAPGLYFVGIAIELGGLLRRAATDARQVALGVARELEAERAPTGAAAAPA